MKREAEILIIGPDSHQAFKSYWAKEKLPFPGLADPDHQVAKQYGQKVSLWKLGRMPEIVIVDKQGYIRFVHHAKNMRDYPALEELYAVLDALGAAEGKSEYAPLIPSTSFSSREVGREGEEER